MTRRNSGHGRKFSLRHEIQSIDRGIEQQLEETGTTVAWHLFDAAASEVDYVYGEGSVAHGLRWRPPVNLRVRTPHRTFTGDQGQDYFAQGGSDPGLLTQDRVAVMTTVRLARVAGIVPDLGYDHDHLRDRFVWDGQVWRPDVISLSNLVGPLRRLWVTIQATAVIEADLVNSPTFLVDSAAAAGQPTDGLYDWQESDVRYP